MLDELQSLTANKQIMHKGYFKIIHTKKMCSPTQAQYFTVTPLKPNEVPSGWPFTYLIQVVGRKYTLL